MFYYILGTLYYTSKTQQYFHLPHHHRADLVYKMTSFLSIIQTSDSSMIGTLPLELFPSPSYFYIFLFFLGVLSALLLRSLTATGTQIGSILARVQLSPSFYQPACLVQYTIHIQEPTPDFPLVIAQFNHFPSWAILPEYKQECLSHLLTSSNKNEFLLFAKYCLKHGDTDGAIKILESCNNFNWPEVHRF